MIALDTVSTVIQHAPKADSNMDVASKVSSALRSGPAGLRRPLLQRRSGEVLHRTCRQERLALFSEPF